MRTTTRWKKLIAAAGLAAALAFGAGTPALADGAAPRDVPIIVENGYQSNRIEVTEGERGRLVFTRRDYTPCTKEVLFPALGIRRMLPTNQAVTVELPALKAGEYEFRCGMNMIRGTVVVRAAR
jgi:plastocyanin domain-containing protein